MKKIFESLKDFLYDSVDYIIVLGIIGVVVVIIGWRIDLLFANDALNVNDQATQIVDNNTGRDIDNDPIYDTEDTDGEAENGDDTEENPDKKGEVVEEITIVKVSIPAGSLPSKIGTILEDKALISSKNEFVQRSQELKLDTKLKSGDFNISTDNSLDDIIYLISK